ncbi:hypothetical protein SpCBS45565_g02562 [Spizellomyces sp. 'palustris']|nr:hypothetical protein SpCBS45565_g02562 [Spizellomyces sp. 'palustris']
MEEPSIEESAEIAEPGNLEEPMNDAPPMIYMYNYDFGRNPSLTISTGRALCGPVVLSTDDASVASQVNFCKGLRWSPDGTCLLSSTNDNVLRLYEKSVEIVDSSSICGDTLTPVIAVKEAECIYDFCWYPFMTSADPSTCCFLTSVRDHPVHLWDAYTGQLRCSYAAHDHLDEVQAPTALAFNLDGTKLYCGFNNLIQIFETQRPGKDSERRPTTPTKRSREGQKGLISSIAFNPDRSGMYAAGSFSKNVGLYDERNDELLHLMKLGDGGGITQVQFSMDGCYLFTASRKSDEIQCWDIRNTGEIIARYQRKGDTNQRINFDLDPSGRYLSTGDQDGHILIYDLKAHELVKEFEGHRDTVSAAGFHPSLPLLASCSGQRRDLLSGQLVMDQDGIECIREDDGTCIPIDSRVCVWGLPYHYDPPMEEST